ncbi:hypothetical protein [Halopseudomonas xiamenensis]|uniref:hypothetical protein n=1 Tax=Halopseudomonas xiamenensis TaxID=157792 RepID=UPI0016295F84|nr:hypothetical protein [Halopseudomonas xiamenensis]
MIGAVPLVRVRNVLQAKVIFMRLVLVCLAFPTVLTACGSAEPPYGLYEKKVPVCFHTPEGFDCEAEASNTLLITPLESGEARVDLEMVFTNGHACSAAGAVGTWAGERLLVSVGTGADACQFTVRFADQEATLSDDSDAPCRTRICGARGVLEGMVLPFKEPAR